MTPTPTARVVLSLALPALAQQVFHLIVNLSDSVIAGRLGEGPEQASIQAAQTTAHYLAWAITSYTVLVTVGSTALVARFVGAGDREAARDVTHQSILLAIFFATTATLVGWLGGIDLLVASLQLQGDAATLAGDYLRVLFVLLAFQVVEQAGTACLVGAGDTRTGLYVMAGVATINVPLAWGFAYGRGPFPELGFVGIAVGTGTSHVVGCVAVLATLARGRMGLTLEWARFRPRVDLIRRLLRVSVPAAADSLSIVVGQLWFLGIVNQLGDVAAAAHGIALRWEALGYLSGHAFGTAAMTIVGQNLGAGRPDDAARGAWRSFAMGCATMTFMGMVFYLFSPAMFAASTNSDAIAAEGIPVLRLVAFAMPALASTIVFTSALRGAGDTRVPVLFTWIGFFVVRIPLTYFLTRATVSLGDWEATGLGLGLIGAWWAMLADLLVRGAFFLSRFLRGRWRDAQV